MKINLEIPKEWNNELTKLQAKNNQSLEELILEILAQHLNINYDSFKVQKLAENLEELKKRIIYLEEQNYQFNKISNKMEILEKLMASLQTQNFKSSSSNINYIMEEDDEIEDEPDEILTDFLVNE